MTPEIPTNSVLEVKLDYIQRDINVIKADIKEIKTDYITRREFENKNKEIIDMVGLKQRELAEKTSTRFDTGEGRVDKLYSIVYWFIGIIGTATLASIFKNVFK